MASLSSRSFHTLWRIRATKTQNGDKNFYLFAMRSDGKLLRRWVKIVRANGDTLNMDASYKLWKKVKPGKTFTAEDLMRALREKGWEDIEVLGAL